MDKKALYKLTYGLFVLTSGLAGEDGGCIINTAGQVTSTPNRISIAVNKTNYTCELIQRSGMFNISVLSEAADFSLFQRFGFQSGRTVNKFAGFAGCRRSFNGLYYITEGTNAYFSAVVEQEIDLGTHMLFIASVEDMEVLSEEPSASYTYYQAHIKPQPQKTEAAAAGKTVWRCRICGYTYEGEELPEDFLCPLCKHPASDFEKVTL